MNRTSLSQYDVYPPAMLAYLRNYGPHFNKKLCDFAVSLMYKEEDGEEKKVKPYTKEQVNNLLTNTGTKLKHDVLYDSVYVANMCKADMLGSAVPDEVHLAKYVKNVIDDIDGYDGIVFNRWYADMSYTGMGIEWEDML